MRSWKSMSFFALQMLALTGLMAIAIRCVDSGTATLDRTSATQPASHPSSLPADPNDAKLLHNPRIVVEKSKHLLTVFEDGRLVKSYAVIIGSGKGDKVREGDRCTPEGEFYVCVKNSQSKYVLSLGLSYPNIEDAQRGLRDKLISKAQYNEILQAIRTKGAPPWKTPLGGEIMIHGCRNGRDTTLGCVAVDNPEIEELFQALPLKTIVEIKP